MMKVDQGMQVMILFQSYLLGSVRHWGRGAVVAYDETGFTLSDTGV